MQRKAWRHDNAGREREFVLSEVLQRMRGPGEDCSPEASSIAVPTLGRGISAAGSEIDNLSGQEARP